MPRVKPTPIPVLPSRDRKGAVLASLVLVLLAGCGYIGQPLPPALKRPMVVTDLTALEHGSNIVIQFTIPKVTTEDLPINGKEDIELRIGTLSDPPDITAWQRSSDRVPVSPKSATAYVEVPASKWYGKTVGIAVNVHGPTGHTLGWSTMVNLPVVPALPVPEALVATDAPDAIQLEWHAAAPEFRVFRRLADEVNWMLAGTSGKPSYTDNTIEYGKTYLYRVQSIEKTGDQYAESEPSAATNFKPTDRFPPAVPAGLTAVPGTRSIELVWDRNTEKDLAGYRVYRNGQPIATNVTAPAYSDRDAMQGVKYQYQVSAVDNAGNESGKSPIAEGVIP
jgi:hypothetical protein